VVLNRNTRSGNAVLGDEMRPSVRRRDDRGTSFADARSFYQVNPAQAQRLYQVALEKAKLEKSDIVLDLY
jgi:tRNA/tmRNA/rRNA uracil-C5-methylase (TrmA/RlmC/RlmD family)